jgi:hypothetical protein
MNRESSSAVLLGYLMLLFGTAVSAAIFAAIWYFGAGR